jgi:HEPN domain-containing protein
MQPQKRYESWLIQAKKDLAWGRDSFKGGHFAQTCFVCQQVAEKSLKSIAFFRGFDIVKSHSLVSILADLKINGPLANAAKILDLYYLASRYPDALPDNGIPSDAFDALQAQQALDFAELFIAASELETGTKM